MHFGMISGFKSLKNELVKNQIFCWNILERCFHSAAAERESGSAARVSTALVLMCLHRLHNNLYKKKFNATITTLNYDFLWCKFQPESFQHFLDGGSLTVHRKARP
jgi:hypothetical protein